MNIPHTLIRSARRTLQLEISPKGEVVIRAPKRISKKYISHFVAQKEEWITKTLLKIKEKKRALQKNENEFFFLGKPWKVYAQRQKPILALVGDYFFVRQDAWKEKERHFEVFCRNFLRKNAEEKIPEMTKKIGVSYNRISINGAKTRWGSCSAKKKS